MRSLSRSCLLVTLLIGQFVRASSAPSNAAACNAPSPIATIYPTNDVPVYITGLAQPEFGVNAYLGIPFAAPPVSDLRFAQPQPVNWNTTFDATAHPPACLQTSPEGGQGDYGISEDCLYLNIIAPQNASDSQPSLPVMVWIYGGAFIQGAATVYNGTGIVAQGIETGMPVIHVTLGYRLGVLGWGNGRQIAANGAANLGLRDVIAALTWIKGNVGAFGGDCSKITVFGESAGAVITSLLFLNPDTDLFRSAIMQSGAQSLIPLGPTATTWQEPYDHLIELTNCSSNATSAGTTNATADQDSFNCLKYLPADQLFAATATLANLTAKKYGPAFVYGPSIDGDVIPDSPHLLLEQGLFARKPFISGNNLDEGTLFTPMTISNDSAIERFWSLFEPSNQDPNITTGLINMYPDDPIQGSPFDTGNDTFGLSPSFKKLAAMLNDVMFQSSRRWFLDSAVKQGMGDKVWSYLFTAYTPGAPSYYGSYHGSDLPFIYGGVTTAANYTEADVLLSRQMVNYWLTFVYQSDPSGATDSQINASYWPAYGNDKQMIQLNGTNTTVIRDVFREEMIDFVLEHPTTFNQ